jgi:hypothetical protein
MTKAMHCACFAISIYCAAGLAIDANAARISDAQIAFLVSESFGPKVRTDVSSGTTMPRYIWTALTGKSTPVLVVPLGPDAAKGTLNAKPIKAILPWSESVQLDDMVGGNCLGLAFFHGLSKTKWGAAPSEVYFLYDCFSDFTRVAAHAPLLRDAHVHAAGEAILLDLETGGQLLVYWSKGRYRTQLVRMGD